MTEAGIVTEATLKSNIEIEIPTETQLVLEEGWGEARNYLLTQNPDHVFLLGRSAELVAAPLEDELIARTSTVHVGRELYHEPTQTDYQYFSSNMARNFLTWFDAHINGKLAPIAKQIESVLTGKKGVLKLALIDDVVETGGTYLVAAWLLRHVLAQKGITNISFSSNNEALARSLMTIPSERKGALHDAVQAEVQVLTLSSDNDWRHNIVDASFAEVFEDLSDGDAEAIERLLGDLVKGSYEVKGQAEPVSFSSWEEVVARAQEIQQSVLQGNIGVANPATILESKYNKQDILSVNSKFQNALREAGRQ
jgi:hypothetical protein